MKNSIFAASAAVVSTASAATNFTNADPGDSKLITAGNWDSGLPNSSSNLGTIGDGDSAAMNESDAVTGYFMRLEGTGSVTGSGLNQGTLNGGELTIDGGSWSASRGTNLSNGQLVTLNSGSWTMQDRTTVVNSSTFTINGGTATFNSGFSTQNSGTINVNGGTVVGKAWLQSFGSGGTVNFNGGTSTGTSWAPTNASTMNFGGSIAGSFTLDTYTSTQTTIDWFNGSLMELTIVGADATFYEGLYTAGDLLFEGANPGTFGDSPFQVTGETLSLAAIPEPSSSALVALGMVALVSLRKRRNA